MKPISLLMVMSTVLTLFLAGCANNRIVIDKKNTDMAAYDRDLVECRSYAEETGGVGAGAAKGAIGGAIVGGAIGAVLGNRRTAEKLGGAAAVSGAVHGAANSKAEKLRIVKTCLAGRGYKVLN